MCGRSFCGSRSFFCGRSFSVAISVTDEGARGAACALCAAIVTGKEWGARHSRCSFCAAISVTGKEWGARRGRRSFCGKCSFCCGHFFCGYLPNSITVRYGNGVWRAWGMSPSFPALASSCVCGKQLEKMVGTGCVLVWGG